MLEESPPTVVELPGPMLAVGRLSGVFGVKGWLKVYSYTRPAENLLNYDPWYFRHGQDFNPLPVAVRDTRGKLMVCRLTGIDVREVAATWVGQEIYVHRDQLPKPPPGEHYWADLIGLEVHNRSGVCLGRIARLLETGAHDILVVRGDRERLIPYVQGVHVLEVDSAGGRVLVDWEADY